MESIPVVHLVPEILMDKVSAMDEKRLSSYAKFTILKSNRLSVAHIFGRAVDDSLCYSENR